MLVQYHHESTAKDTSHGINIKVLGFPSQYFVGDAEWHFYTPKLSFYGKGLEEQTSLFYHK